VIADLNRSQESDAVSTDSASIRYTHAARVIEAHVGHAAGFRAGAAGTYDHARCHPERIALAKVWAERVQVGLWMIDSDPFHATPLWSTKFSLCQTGANHDIQTNPISVFTLARCGRGA